jgi:hypothetical protein
MSQSRSTSASIGIVNANAGVAVWAGLGGLRADANALPVPANTAIVFPLAAEDVEIAAVPAPAGRVLVFVLRFESVQPFYLGRFA